jgi:hypothetical protein
MKKQGPNVAILDPKDTNHVKIMAVFGFTPHAVVEGIWVTHDKTLHEIDAREPTPLHEAVSRAHKRAISLAEHKRITATRALLLPLLGLEIVEVNHHTGEEAFQFKDLNELAYFDTY